MVSGTLSLPCSGCFSPFPHGTGSLSVSWEYLALPDGPGRFTQDSTCPALLRIPLCHCTEPCKGLSPATAAFSNAFHFRAHVQCRGPTTPHLPRQVRFGLFPGRSPLLGESLLFSLPAGTKMFQFPAFASLVRGMSPLQDDGLSHSEISGSRVICTYPELVAACHVLLRLQEPRHPPSALFHFLVRRTQPFSRMLLSYTSSFLLFDSSFSRSVSNKSKIVPASFRGLWRITDSNR